MASYNYGPPPPAPAPAPPTNTAGSYPYSQGYSQHGHHRGAHTSRGGRGGGSYNSGRVDYHGTSSAYGYGAQQPPTYAHPQQSPAPYAAPQAPQTGYSAQPQPQWHADQGQHHSHIHQQPQQPQHPHQHQATPQPASLPAQNYHPNYAPQIYQQPPAYGQQQQPQPQPPQQPQYAPPPQQSYAPQYQTPPVPPAQQWSGPAPYNQNQYGSARGGRGGHHDRGGSKAPTMGPPMRMGFDQANQQGHPAPVSNGYPQPYAATQPAPVSYPQVPYQQSHPHPAAPYGAQFSSSPPGPRQQHGHGGYHNHNSNFRSRHQFGGDKMRHRRQDGRPFQTPNPLHQKPDAASAGKKKKRKTNTLGLTPDDGDDSNEEYENEEEVLTQLIGADAPNPADIAEWIAERRRNYPTKARIEAKRAAEAAQNGGTKKEGSDRDAILEKQQQKAEKLRRQLEKVESSIKRKREQQDEGDDMRNMDISPSISSDSKSDDEKPEALSTKEQVRVPPATRKADQSKHCKYYSTGGTCGKKGKCRFVHDPQVREAALKEREMNGGRMTLQQRLILNDKEQEDLTIVRTLAYLQEKGLMGAGSQPGAAAQSASNPASQLNHIHSASLPPNPVKKERETIPGLPAIPPPSVLSGAPSGKRYEGWNLSGFGNTGVRAGEI